jgi:PadR family transcriptional regulator, regulatory protein PadR
VPDSALSDVGRRSRSWTMPCQPKNFLQPCLLLLLDEQPDYGYDLRERLGRFNAPSWDAGTIYRCLNGLEEEGLASSTWEPSRSGPQRRRYEISDAGRRMLDAWSRELDEVHHLVLRFLQRFMRRQEVHLIMGAPSPVAATPASRVGL